MTPQNRQEVMGQPDKYKSIANTYSLSSEPKRNKKEVLKSYLSLTSEDESDYNPEPDTLKEHNPLNCSDITSQLNPISEVPPTNEILKQCVP